MGNFEALNRSALDTAVPELRDGASAQYGSDAIAGVIDLRLREDRDGGDATVSYGVHKTTYDILTGQPPDGTPAAPGSQVFPGFRPAKALQPPTTCS